MKNRHQFVHETLAEAEWLAKRAKRGRVQLPVGYSTFPTALHFFGSQVSSRSEVSVSSKSTIFGAAGNGCLLLSSPSSGEEKRPAYDRRLPKWATLAFPDPEFGDRAEIAVFNPPAGVSVEDEVSELTWLANPLSPPSLPVAILMAARDCVVARNLMGDSRPLSPVIQPHFPFHVRRNKRRSCPTHAPKEIDPQEEGDTDARAYKAAWNRGEPLSLPPLCSCANDELIASYTELLGLCELTDSGTPELALLEQRCAAFLAERGACGVCAGLQYYPYSLLEVSLSHDVPGLAEVVQVYPFPSETDCYAEGPKVTLCVVAKSPKHEWEIYKALLAVHATEAVVVYDICSVHFRPGVQLSDLYWSRTLPTSTTVVPMSPTAQPLSATEMPITVPPLSKTVPPLLNSEQPLTVSGTAYSTPLYSPPQHLLNISTQKSSLQGTPINSFASRGCRRPFCVRPRVLPDPVALRACVSDAELAQLQSAHEERVLSAQTKPLIQEIFKCRFVAAQELLDLQGLRDQALALNLTATPRIPVKPPPALQVIEVPTMASVDDSKDGSSRAFVRSSGGRSGNPSRAYGSSSR